jgi:hypothetical protein
VLLSSAPVQIQLPFGNGDVTKTNPVPVPSQIGVTPGAASFTDGFPPLNATPVSSGGIPPFKTDMNGILFMTSAIDRWMSAGGGFKFDAGFAAAIGGYPKGARVLNAAGNGYWQNLADNNSVNPDTTGTNWLATWRAVAGVYASAQQLIGSGTNLIVFDTVEFDTFSMWDAANHTFKCPWAGKYRLSGAVYLPTPDPGNYTVSVYKNGSLEKRCIQFPQVSSVPLIYPFDAIVIGAVNDFLQPYLTAATGTYAGQVGTNQSLVYGQLEYLGS